MVDTSRGGAISKAEFVVFYRAEGTFADYALKENGAMTEENWKKYMTDYGISTDCTFSSVDTSANKLISRSEYYASFYNAGCKPSAKTTFVKYDTDSNGRWSAEEFAAYSEGFEGCGIPPDTPCPFAVTDTSSDGSMSEEEFVSAVTSHEHFSEFDEDGDLKLNENEWALYDNKYGQGSRRQAGSFGDVDQDSSGYCEYCNEVLKPRTPKVSCMCCGDGASARVLEQVRLQRVRRSEFVC